MFIMSNKLQIARLISTILNPIIVCLIALFVVLFNSGLTNIQIIWSIIFSLIILFGLPLVLLKIAINQKKLSDFDITKRQERIIPLFILLILLVIDYFVLKLLTGNIVSKYILLMIIHTFGFTLITFWWKISAHSSLNTLSAVIIISVLGIKNWWLVLLIIPVVSWARIIKKDHTVAQVIAGIIYAFFVTLFFSFFYYYLS